MVDGPCGHRSGIRLKYFFHQHRAVLVRCAGVAPGDIDDVDLFCALALVAATATLALPPMRVPLPESIGHHRLPDVFSARVLRRCPTRFFCSKVRYADPAVILASKQRVRPKVPADYPLAPQDPEELGTDEPPDVSKSARDRPVHTRAYGTVTWGKGPRRAVGDRVRPYLHRSQRRAVSGGR